MAFITAVVTWGILLSLPLSAQQFQVTALRLSGGAHLLINTNGKDLRFTHQLSEDKRKISIVIADASISGDKREENALNGRIESVFMQRSGTNVIVTLVLREKSGYTASLLPYSRSVAVDVFDWSGLSAAEDNYRSGLIALNNNIPATAKEYFNKAHSDGHADATAYMSFLSVREGNVREGKIYADLALSRKTSLADIYGALAEISREEKNDAKVREYEQEFSKRTGRLPYFDEERIAIEVSAAPRYEPTSLVMAPRTDTAAGGTTPITADSSENTLSQQLQALQGKSSAQQQADTTNLSATKSTSFVPSWFSSLIFGTAAALIMVGILLIRSYSKWKREQLLYAVNYAQQMQQQQPPAFASDLHAAMNSNEHQAAQAYAKAGSLLDMTDDKPATEQTHSATHTDTPIPQEEESEQQELFDFDDSFYREYEQQRAESQNRSILTNTQPTVPQELFYQTPGKAELSNNILNEQQRLRQETLHNIQQSGLPTDDETLEQLARQLGVEVGMLKATKHINSIGQDGEQKKTMAKKFATD